MEVAVAEFCQYHRLTPSSAESRIELTLTNGVNQLLDVDHTHSTDRQNNPTALSVVFANLDLGKKRTGIENAALLRARLMEQYLGITPYFLTTKFDPEILATKLFLVKNGLAPESMCVLNLYDFFQSRGCPESDTSILANPGDQATRVSFSVVRSLVPGASNFRVAGPNNSKVAYEKWNDDGTKRLYSNYLFRNKQYRRDTFDAHGNLIGFRQVREKGLVCQFSNRLQSAAPWLLSMCPAVRLI